MKQLCESVTFRQKFQTKIHKFLFDKYQHVIINSFVNVGYILQNASILFTVFLTIQKHMHGDTIL